MKNARPLPLPTITLCIIQSTRVALARSIKYGIQMCCQSLVSSRHSSNLTRAAGPNCSITWMGVVLCPGPLKSRRPIYALLRIPHRGLAARMSISLLGKSVSGQHCKTIQWSQSIVTGAIKQNGGRPLPNKMLAWQSTPSTCQSGATESKPDASTTRLRKRLTHSWPTFTCDERVTAPFNYSTWPRPAGEKNGASPVHSQSPCVSAHDSLPAIKSIFRSYDGR
ncbi:hypothetical protein L209DRAFT_107818 [Thermothelomyces heterothallicus CBS 203.75]